MHSDNTNPDMTSGANVPFWFIEATAAFNFESLQQDTDTDILVIGGGIAGLTTAYNLSKEGRKVILVEDGHIASGETGRTTAHITCALDDRYFEIEDTFDRKTAELAAASHMAAIEFIAHTVKLNEIDCNFKRVDGYLFLDATDTKETLEKEYAATKNVGINTEMLQTIPAIAAEDGNWCIKFPDQGQFHILKYIKGLADAFIKSGGKIYTNSRAEKINSKGATVNGFEVRANHIVVATNTPVNDMVTMHTKQWPYRTYVIAAKVRKGKLPYSLWWDTGNMESKWVSQPYHYVRLEEFDDTYDMLISGGEDHRTGQADDEDVQEEQRYFRLEDWTRKRFPDMETVEFRWSGQVMEPLDCLAFIGKNPGDDNIYIITGDSGNGITHGTIGGILITDLIMGRKNSWEKIYDPSRITLNTAADFLQEAGNMVAQYADWFTAADIKSVSELKPGEGGVLSSGLKKTAVYRDNNNTVHACTAVCPHMGGLLQWNADEKTFDCPLHGSRFDCHGKMLNGPAITDLKKTDLNK
jgi:glycine/D-amino acid oxidase-like deaminating enzyme/nitrite reductase/ring-hydroxylating ferredoxin subunit